jgi:hypothetical protein
MYQAIQMPRRLFYRFPHLIVAIEVEDIRHEVERVLVVLDLRVEPRQVESVGEIFFVNLAEVLIPSRRYELVSN